MVLMRVEPPHPLAYCVLLYFKPAYHAPLYFGIAYCIMFNNKNNLFGGSIYIKKTTFTVCGMHRHIIILSNTSFVVFA